MSDSTKLIDMIRRSPGIRTLQLCDQLDVGIDVVDTMIEKEIANGTIVAFDVVAPNQRKAVAYKLPGAVVPNKQPLTEVPTPRSHAAASTSKVNTMPAALDKTKTKAEIVIDFIKKQESQSATGAQIHQLLQLKPVDHPSSYLAPAIADGRLVKNGKTWTLGSGVPVKKAEKPVEQKVAPKEIPPYLLKDAPIKIKATAPVIAKKLAAEVVHKEPENRGLVIQMTPVPIFNIQIGGMKLDGLREVSEWNGMKELRDQKGRKLIVMYEIGMFSELFSSRADKQTSIEASVISAHPELIAEILKAASADKVPA